TGDPSDPGTDPSDPGTDPSDPGNDPGNEDPPEDPPTPPPPGTSGLLGGFELSGIWEGWVARHRMGEKFDDYGSYGTMSNNTNAATKIDEGKSGWFSCDIYYDTTIHPGEGGGQHLIGLFSQSAKRAGPYDPAFDYDELTGWVRLDFAVRNEELALVMFEERDGGLRSWQIGLIPFVAFKQWASLHVEWEQTDTRIRWTINDRSFTTDVSPGRNPVGNLLFIGNMDRNSGDRCTGENDPCGLLGEVRFRNFRWGTR
ncbi:MAG: hypothetical protein PVF43_14460, partial [Candidatus Eiseniibacteriota bacterium]